MDFMLEEELMDLITFCLQNPDSLDAIEKKKRITDIGQELFLDGGIDALENFFFSIASKESGFCKQKVIKSINSSSSIKSMQKY